MSPHNPPHLVEQEEEEEPLPSDGEGDRSQIEAKDDVALLVSLPSRQYDMVMLMVVVVENHGL